MGVMAVIGGTGGDNSSIGGGQDIAATSIVAF